jgi:methyl-accepting chemotaxis protein
MGGMGAVITFVGISALKTLNENAAHMTAAAQRALTERAPDRMCWLSRTEFRSALDPRPENRSFTRKFEEKVKQFEVRIAELKKPRS